MISWGLFAELMGRFPGVFVGNGNLIKKMSFPKICLPIAALVSSLVNFIITFTVLVGVLLVLGVRPSMVWFSLIPLVSAMLILALGLGMLLAVVNVFFRDVGPMFSIVMQFWFWATPIVYPVSILPDWLAAWMVWNPVAAVVQGFQNVILYDSHPSYIALAGVFALGLMLCALAARVYGRRVGQMVDEL
jgi:lipopolysaccharide transport system permease protein